MFRLQSGELLAKIKIHFDRFDISNTPSPCRYPVYLCSNVPGLMSELSRYSDIFHFVQTPARFAFETESEHSVLCRVLGEHGGYRKNARLSISRKDIYGLTGKRDSADKAKVFYARDNKEDVMSAFDMLYEEFQGRFAEYLAKEKDKLSVLEGYTDRLSKISA